MPLIQHWIGKLSILQDLQICQKCQIGSLDKKVELCILNLMIEKILIKIITYMIIIWILLC